MGPAQMWTNNTYRDRTRWLWDMVACATGAARRWPPTTCSTSPGAPMLGTMAAFAYELFKVVRAKDPEHVIILPGHASGIDAYGNPNARPVQRGARHAFLSRPVGLERGAGRAKPGQCACLGWLHCNAA
ncbi:hypothetical protein LP419_14805 [Massilia sp. H-1]|nr:hypothetical protein LP419_14805 [Massilia sp. H-1]